MIYLIYLLKFIILLLKYLPNNLKKIKNKKLKLKLQLSVPSIIDNDVSNINKKQY
jgi:hypothetical protein